MEPDDTEFDDNGQPFLGGDFIHGQLCILDNGRQLFICYEDEDRQGYYLADSDILVLSFNAVYQRWTIRKTEPASLLLAQDARLARKDEPQTD